MYKAFVKVKRICFGKKERIKPKGHKTLITEVKIRVTLTIQLSLVVTDKNVFQTGDERNNLLFYPSLSETVTK